MVALGRLTLRGLIPRFASRLGVSMSGLPCPPGAEEYIFIGGSVVPGVSARFDKSGEDSDGYRDDDELMAGGVSACETVRGRLCSFPVLDGFRILCILSGREAACSVSDVVYAAELGREGAAKPEGSAIVGLSCSPAPGDGTDGPLLMGGSRGVSMDGWLV